jgi:hypothetical protein
MDVEGDTELAFGPVPDAEHLVEPVYRTLLGRAADADACQNRLSSGM